ncbi:hypothetical protein O181_035227 [Austropuccinia psidii MF-1]|uniref:Uncharacterized protein n=1 Tax=Austropuccinia psidii MF-1 TaxID=1389203 RepID=A0A9Q3D880_9BASI|nr:hypothetical protein [Austropuccinia psidii MF-1]
MPRTSQRLQALTDLELMWLISKIDENHQHIAKYLGLPTLPTLVSEMYPQDQAQSTVINQYFCQSNMYRKAIMMENRAYTVFWYLAFDWWMNWIMEVNRKWNLANHEAVSLISNKLHHNVFISIFNSQTVCSANSLWTKIHLKFAPQTFVYNGRVWLRWECLKFNGNIKEYMKNCHTLLQDISSIGIVIPNKILAYSILGKISQDCNTYDHIIDNLVICKVWCHNHGNSPPWISIWHIKPQSLYGKFAISMTSGQYDHVIILWTIYGHLTFGAFMAPHLNPEAIAAIYTQLGISGHFPQNQKKWPKWLFLAIWAHDAHFAHFCAFCAFCAL